MEKKLLVYELFLNKDFSLLERQLTKKGKCVYYQYQTNIPLNFSGSFEHEPEEEDSLENTFSCVPKVQGESRISQVNGRRSLQQASIVFSGSPC